MVVNWKITDWESIFKSYGLVPRPKGMHRTDRDKRDTLNIFCAFDIETSTKWLNENRKEYDVHSWMYSWAFQVEDMTVLGREWSDFFAFLDRLAEACAAVQYSKRLGVAPKLIIWVHNLAYEWAFLSGLYPFTNEECFFRDIRKPIYIKMKGVFEFRCSYIQTNLSLAVLCKQMGVPEKLSGQKFDYNKIRYPWTPLTDYEREYIITDVESLVLAMKKRVMMNGDNLLTVPLTSTGYVRRECKESIKSRFFDIREMKPDERQYKLLRKAFRGGNTHANRTYAGKIINDVISYDIVSCYPTQQLTQRFPMKPFRWLDMQLTLERVLKFIGLGYAVVGLYQFKGLRLKNKKCPIPYISLSCTDTEMYREEEYTDSKGRTKKRQVLLVKLDNGRILESHYTEIALTEIDLQIVLSQYDFDEIGVLDCMVAQKDFLPAEYRAVIQKFYSDKTKLKGDDSDQGIYLYTKSKNMLNSVYGMSATDPIHQEIVYSDGEYSRMDYEKLTEDEKKKALRSAPFPYQWGVYTTALARAQLQRAIDAAGPDQIIYCDTDSIKVKGKVDIGKLNELQMKKAITAEAFADDMHGHRHYIGLFEQDAKYDRFITQGAKRYAYEHEGKLGVTVSGVTKLRNENTGEFYAVEELQRLENFRVGMVWEKAGGTMAVYNDNDDFYLTDEETGKQVHVTKNVSIIPTTYKLTYSKDYSLLLGEIKLYGQYRSERE